MAQQDSGGTASENRCRERRKTLVQPPVVELRRASKSVLSQPSALSQSRSSLSSFGLSGQASDILLQHSGLLIDFLVRDNASKSRPVQKAGRAEDLLSHLRNTSWTGYLHAVQSINQEMLLSGLSQDIAIFWKANSHPDWIVRNSGVLYKQISKTMKYKKEASLLCTEVNSWYFRHQILRCRPPDSESPRNRYGRCQQFWADFHEGSRKTELKAMAPPFKDDLRKRLHRDNLVELPPEHSKKASKTGRTSVQCLRRPDGIKRGASIVRDLDWKRQPARSKVTAGTWDWAHGASSLSRSATPTSKKEKTSHWATALFDLADEELEEFADPVSPALSVKEETEEEVHHAEFVTQLSIWEARETEKNIRKLVAEEELFVHAHRPVSSQESSLKSKLPNCQRQLLPSSSMSKSASMPNFRKIAAAFDPDYEPNVGKLNSRPGSVAHVDPSLLPPTSKPFKIPWQSKSSQPILKCMDSPSKQYLRACRSGNSIPRPLPFITGHSLKFDASGQSLSDDDLLAVTVTLEEQGIEEVDLGGNTALTERSLIRFTQALARYPASNSLRSLSFKGVRHAGQAVLVNIVRALDALEGARNLRLLDLTDVSMGMKCYLPFAQKVRDHTSLKTLNLVNTGLGSGAHIRQFVQDVLGSKSLEALDLGWNCFSAETFSLLGEKHIEMQRIQRLGLSNCAAAPEGVSVIVYFLEHLSRDQALRSLDISMNRIDFRAALVLEDVLTHVKKLSQLDISHNPLGILGMRSLLRLLCCDCSGLLFFHCEDCATGVSRQVASGHPTFRGTNPGGRYSLDLVSVYHRSLLRMLYKACDFFKLAPEEAFSNIFFSKQPWKHAEKDGFGVWVLPQEGKFRATFSIDLAIQQEMRGIDPHDFDNYISRYFRLVRTFPSFRKVIPLFGQWRSIDGREPEQLVFLDALAKDFLLTPAHMQQFCSNRAVAVDVIERLASCVHGGSGAVFLSLMLVNSVPDYVKVLKSVSCFLQFNIQNPTGHYKLDLGKHMDHAVAERLLLLDRWETHLNICHQQQRMDMSQRGNKSVLRNETWCHQSILRGEVRAMSEWSMPEFGVFEVDYSSSRRISADSMNFDDVTMSNLMVTLAESPCSDDDKVIVLRMISHDFCITALSLRKLFGCVKAENLKALAELYVIFFFRVVDIYNEKVFRVRIDNDTLAELRHRLGFLATFPFIQPERVRFTFEFGVHDQALAANMLMNLSSKEDPYNLREAIFVLPNGKKEALTSGVPRTWEYKDKMPPGGSFSVTYHCAPDVKKFTARMQMMETYGGWKLQAEEDKVMWWSSLDEAPADVLSFMRFLLMRFWKPPPEQGCKFDKSLDNSFRKIDGPDGNGVISLREFEEAFVAANDAIGCKIFQGKDEIGRIQRVFRWLDSDGNGQVSQVEFSSQMEQLYKEIKLSLCEFIEFCERMFGDDMNDAWSVLDADNSGAIDEEEWQIACEKIGYRGPIQCIFAFLAGASTITAKETFLVNEDKGEISREDFDLLKQFQQQSSRNAK